MSANAAEQLWMRAHEHLNAGNLAQAVRDLAKAYGILKDIGDPRLAQVHKRWTEVHQMYVRQKSEGAPQISAQQAEAARAQQAQAEAARAQAAAQAQPDPIAVAEAQFAAQEQERERRESAPMSLEEQAETAANMGQLAQAVEIYQRVVAAQPENELVQERLQELQKEYAQEQKLNQPATALHHSPPRGTPMLRAPLTDDNPDAHIALLRGLLVEIDNRRKPLL